MRSPARAFYDGITSGGLLGFVIGALFVLLLLPTGDNVPSEIWLLIMGVVVLAVSMIAYDAHKVLSD